MALGELVIVLPVLAVAAVEFRIDDDQILADAQAQAVTGDAALDRAGTTHEDRLRELLVDHDLHGPQHALVLALGEHDAAALRRELARGREDRRHHRAAVIDELLQALAVFVEVGDGAGRDTGIHRRARHRGRDAHDEARVERLRDQVIGAKGEVLDASVGLGDDIALLLARKVGDRLYRGDFHLARDRRRADIEGSAEYEREAEHVVDLVRIIAAAGRNHRIVAHRLDLFGEDFRRRIGEREDQRARRHRLDHIGLEHAARGEAEKDIRAADHLGELARLRRLREALLERIHELGAAFIDHAGKIREPDLFARQPQIDQQLNASQRRGACAADHEFDLRHLLADDS